MAHVLVFHPADNPMQLSKIGNWLFTYLSPATETTDILLAITSVLPHQLSHGLQPQRMTISGQAGGFEWTIQQIEFFDNTTSTAQSYPVDDVIAFQFIQQFVQDCQKYDVEVTYHPLNS